jgi:cyclase
MTIPYTKGLHQLTANTYAYLIPDGSWALTNTGLVVDSGEALLVDTLFTLAMNHEMLTAIYAELPDVEITTVVNTHDDGDHCFGNQLFADKQIIASAASTEHMQQHPMVHFWRDLITRANAGQPGDEGEFFRANMGAFDLTGVVNTPATTTYTGEMTVQIGQLDVRLIQVGPAHTDGDTLVVVPEEGVLFAGDILFVDSHPLVHTGPIPDWISACELILGLDVDTIVPGHGPLTDKAYVARLRDYLQHVTDYSAQALARGLDVRQAAAAFPMTAYADWIEPDRIVMNIGAAYRGLGGPDHSEPELIAMLTEFWAELHGLHSGGTR